MLIVRDNKTFNVAFDEYPPDVLTFQNKTWFFRKTGIHSDWKAAIYRDQNAEDELRIVFIPDEGQ